MFEAPVLICVCVCFCGFSFLSGAGDQAVVHNGNGGASTKVAGGAFFDLASQSLTPLVGGRGSVGLGANSVQGRRAGAAPVRCSRARITVTVFL